MTTVTSSSGSGPSWYWTGTNSANGFTQVMTVIPPNLTLRGDDLIRLPDHEFRPTERTGQYCQDCPAGSPYMDSPGKHLYVIREWEIG